jgi:glutamate-5-semialdehyde dehydrogenase
MNKIEIKKYIKNICIAAKCAAISARSLSNTKRIMIIKKIIKNLKDSKNIIIRKNSIDINLAKRNSLSDALIDRLLINGSRVKSMIEGTRGN